MDIIISIAVGLLMFALGLNMDFTEFKNHFAKPKGLTLGVICQIILPPIVGYLVIIIFGIKSEYALGIMVGTAVPRGTTSSVITFWAKGDTALSVSLTSISSIISTFLSLPFIVYISYQHFLGESLKNRIDPFDIILQLFLIVVMPVILALAIKGYFDTQKLNKILRYYIIIYYLLMLITGTIIFVREWDSIKDNWSLLLSVCVVIILVLLTFGYAFSYFLKLGHAKSKTIAIETAFQNNNLAFALSIGIIEIERVGIPSMFYGILMTFIGLLIVWHENRQLAKQVLEKIRLKLIK